jgi:hypothetical protein
MGENRDDEVDGSALRVTVARAEEPVGAGKIGLPLRSGSLLSPASDGGECKVGWNAPCADRRHRDRPDRRQGSKCQHCHRDQGDRAAAALPDRRRVEPRIVDPTVEKGPARRHDQGNDDGEEDAAIDDVIKADGEVEAGLLSDENGSPGADSVGEDGDDDCRSHERRAAPP